MTLAEIGRRLGEQTEAMRELTRKIDEFPATMARTYQPRELARSWHDALVERIDGVKEDVQEVRASLDRQAEQRRGDRRLAVSGLVLPLIVVVLGGVLVWALTGGGS